MVKKGSIIVVSAPSGAGKSTLCTEIRKRIPTLSYSVSYTTRAPRKGEENGKDYNFISVDEFKSGIDKGLWAEYAEVHGNYYGTSKEYLERAIEEGKDILLEIDVQGAGQVKSQIDEALLVFINPPSMEELEKRLTKRGTDSPEVIEKRLLAAKGEMDQAEKFDVVITNDVFSDAADEFHEIIIEKTKSEK